jgi:hypothetical protein
MPEVRVQLPDDLMQQLQSKMPNLKPTTVTQDAVALYAWAVNERANGRVILSSDPSGNNTTQITTPSLSSITVKTG